MNRPFALLLVLLLAPTSFAAETPADAQLKQYFRAEAARLSEQCLADIHTLEDWNSRRAEFRRQYQEMLGLWPMPERTDLKPGVTGKLEHEEFTVEKLHFQASPGLYVTAALFLPKNLTSPAPTILYESGHWRVIDTNGISYGNKAAYQGRGAWFAQNGYVCLVLDTVLSGEIQGIHTGTRDRGLWWWNSRGYTPAGVEAWFGIRALDYLSTRPEVDTNRFGITGHSGGGAYSWAVTALDDRIKVAAPLAGMADLHAHVVEGIMDSHCDCNFPINYYGWDFPQIAALAAPRPLLIGSTDNDRLFNLENTIRIHEKVRRIYQLHKATDKLGLAIAPGPHDEVPELQLAVLRWFNRHLKGEEKPTPVTVDVKSFFSPTKLKVFTELPTDAINTNIAETFVPTAAGSSLSSPKGGEGRGEEAKIQNPSPQTSPRSGGAREMNSATSQNRSAPELAEVLRTNVFRGWPTDDLPLHPNQVFSIEKDGVQFSAWDFMSQPEVPLRLYLLIPTKLKPSARITLEVFDHAGFTNWCRTVAQRFPELLNDEAMRLNFPPVQTTNRTEPLLPANSQNGYAFFAPRGHGLSAWSGDLKEQTRNRRRFMALGQTLDGMQVWDIRRAIELLHFIRDADSAQVELRAAGVTSFNALFAALYEPSVRVLDLGGPGISNDVPDFLGWLRHTDMSEVMRATAAQLTRR